nr:MAG TPA: U1 small nuclear ribonucleoprotein [Caudoviricetes sp.]
MLIYFRFKAIKYMSLGVIKAYQKSLVKSKKMTKYFCIWCDI